MRVLPVEPRTEKRYWAGHDPPMRARESRREGNVMANLLRDTEPTRIAQGRYRLDLSREWNFRDPSGGVLTTVALRAAQAELGDPELRARSATTLFSSAVHEGPLVMQVDVLRKGGAAAQVRVNVRNEGQDEPGLDLLATLGRDLASGPTFVDADPPNVPRPEDAPLLVGPTPVAERFLPRFFENLDVRLALGHFPWKNDWKPGRARICRWMRYREPQCDPRGLMDPSCLPPVMDTMPPSAIQKLGPGFRPFIAPSLDLTVHFFEPPRSEWLLVDTQTLSAGAGYGSANVRVWDQRGRLAGYATQLWMFRKVPSL